MTFLAASFLAILSVQTAPQLPTERALTNSNQQFNAFQTGFSYMSISADGRFVGFLSYASNIVPGDTNAFRDVFVWDRDSGAIERVNVSTSGAECNGTSAFSVHLSHDGRFALFFSEGSNLAAGDTNLQFDAFIRDRTLGTTERVLDSLVAAGTSPSGATWVSPGPCISGDGRYVVVSCDAPDVHPADTDTFFDIFRVDRMTGSVELISRNLVPTNGQSYFPTISADGATVAFYSESTNFVANDTNGVGDIFVWRDGVAGLERISVSSQGAQGDGVSYRSVVSPDGQAVQFHSDAVNLVPGDNEGQTDLFVRELGTSTTWRVSEVAGVGGDAFSSLGGFSGDSRRIVFSSDASNLSQGDTNGATDIFLYDRVLGRIRRISSNVSGLAPNGESGWETISLDGRYIAYESSASDLVPGDSNGGEDIFVTEVEQFYLDHDAPTRGATLTLTATGVEAGERVYFGASLAGTGAGPCFGSACLDLLSPLMNLGSSVADVQGLASLNMTVPQKAPLVGVWTQALVIRGFSRLESVVSNVEYRVIQP